MVKTQYVEVEQQVLSILLRDGRYFNECDLLAEDFCQTTHSQLFAAMQDLANAGQAIDFVSVGIRAEEKFGSVDMSYLADIFEKCIASPQNIGKYAGMIKQACRLRKARNIALDLSYRVENAEDDSFIDETIQALMALNQGSVSYESDLKESLRATVERLDYLHNNPGLPGLTTGIDGLDTAIGGWQPSKLYVFAGRPGKGKSALMMNFVNTLLKNDIPSTVFSLEMEREELASRLIAMNGSLHSQKMTTAKFDENDWTRLQNAVIYLQQKSLRIVDQSNMPIIPMMRSARRGKQEHDIQAVFVDYIQIVRGTNPRQNTLERITEVTQMLKQMARELKIPVIALAQLKRDADDLSGPAGMNHLADASAIEKDADFIGTLYASEEMENDGRLLIHTCKNRGGPKGDIMVNYERPFYRITPMGKTMYAVGN